MDLNPLREAVIDGNSKTTRALVEKALAEGVDARELVTTYLIPAMDEVGRRFECNEFFVPEMLIAARAMKGALELVKPRLAASGAKPTGKALVGTVKGDLHDIGKNLVCAMLEGGGFEVFDLGVDVPPDRFVAEIKAKTPDLVVLSALLTTTMPAMKDTVEAINAAGVRKQIKIMIGGAPVTDGYAKEIGADGYSDSASAAVVLARKLMKG
jgi:corrinoid protein of di/trimethylamine methyltransferase